MRDLTKAELNIISGGKMCTSKKLSMSATCAGFFGTFVAAVGAQLFTKDIADVHAEGRADAAETRARAVLVFGVLELGVTMVSSILNYLASMYPKCEEET